MRICYSADTQVVPSQNGGYTVGSGVPGRNTPRNMMPVRTAVTSNGSTTIISPVTDDFIQGSEYGGNLFFANVFRAERRKRLQLYARIAGGTSMSEECHPRNDDHEAYLWTGIGTTNKGDPIVYRNLLKRLKTLADKADVKKKVNPYNFRHSRATRLANKLTEAQLREYFGWVQGSDQPATYVCLSGRDTENASLQLHDLKKEEKSEEEETVECPRCEYRNPQQRKVLHEVWDGPGYEDSDGS